MIEFPLGEMIRRMQGTGTAHPPLYFLFLKGWAALGVARSSLFVPWQRSVVCSPSPEPMPGSWSQPASPGLPRWAPARAVTAPGPPSWLPPSSHLTPCKFSCRSRCVDTPWERRYWSGAAGALPAAPCGPEVKGHATGFYSVCSASLSATPITSPFFDRGTGSFHRVLFAPPAVPPARAKRLDLANAPAALLGGGSMLAIGLGYLLWVPHLTSQAAAVAHTWRSSFRLRDAANETFIALLGTFANRFHILPATAWLTVSMVVVLFALLLYSGSGGRCLALIGLVPVALLLGYSALRSPNLYYSRYLTFAQIAWIAGAGFLLTYIPSAVGRWVWSGALLAGCVFCCVYSWDVIGPTASPGMREAMQFVHRRRLPDEPLAVKDSALFLESLYYSHAGRRPRYFAEQEAIPSLLGAAQLTEQDPITPQMLKAQKPPGIWFVYQQGKSPSGLLTAVLGPKFRLVKSEAFPQDYRWEGTVIVEYYEAGP